MLNISIGYGEVLAGVVLVLIGQYLLANWLATQIVNSSQADLERKLSSFKRELDQLLADSQQTEQAFDEERILDRASRVASLLTYVRAAEDIKHPDFLRMAWELSLWLPAGIYAKLRECRFGLCSDDEVKEVLLATRKYLLKDKAEGMTKEDIPPLGRGNDK